MSSITLEFNYSEKCPHDAIQIESAIFDSSFSFEGDSFTTEDHKIHIFRFNYDSVEVAKSAYARIQRKASQIFRKFSKVVSYDISRNNERVTVPEF